MKQHHSLDSDVSPNGRVARIPVPHPIGESPVCVEKSADVRGELSRAPGKQFRYAQRRLSQRVMISLAVVAAFLVMFIGWEVAERHLFPTMSIGMHHALLTVRAACTTMVASVIVYLLMHGHQRRLAGTAQQITDVLESYAAHRGSSKRFENPHLVSCRELLQCKRTDCVMYGSSSDRRCWQEVALRRYEENGQTPRITIHQCHECEVYRRCCPDPLTELGESFNNLMFLLDEEARQTRTMRSQLVEKEKMVAIGQMASGIAHEVCNPLSSISSIAQVLRRSRSGTARSEELELIEKHVGRISSIVRQLVTLSRPGTERWERADIHEILEEVVRLVRFDQRAKNVDVVFKRPRALPQTYVLPGQLQQVFLNLSLNALDAMPGGGRMVIETLEHSGHIIVRVADSGSGIASSIGRRVFEPFFTTKEAGRGTGLGLSVSYSIVRKHGGSLEFESTPETGTVFHVDLPILTKAPGG